MNYSELFNRVADLDLVGKYRINSGGCGVFALEMHKHCPDLDIVYVGCEVRGRTDEGRIGGAPQHVVLSDGEVYYDALGVRAPSYIHNRYGDEEKTVTAQYLEDSLECSGCWNSRFHWHEVDNIIELLDVTVKDYNNEQQGESS